MEHPLKDKKFIFYSGFWLIIISLHATFLFYQFNLPLSISIVDSLISNFLAAAACFTYWYVVKYISPNRQGMTETIFSHLIGITIFVLLITYTSGSILQIVFSEEEYHSFVKRSVLFRLILLTLYFTITIMLYYLLIYVDNINQQFKKEAELQNLLRQTSLDMLLFQINPHFLFNSLNSISSLTITAPNLAREMVIKLADFFRASLKQNSGDIQSLKEEMDQMYLYLEIEKIRFEDRLVIASDIKEECLQMKLPKMILQPLYENAIKFGVYENLGPITIRTLCSCQEGNLQITISNDFHTGNIKRKGAGVGIKNVGNRLKLIYGIDDLTKVIHENGIYSINLTIPQKTNS